MKVGVDVEKRQLGGDGRRGEKGKKNRDLLEEI